jgi:hypothetical protein
VSKKPAAVMVPIGELVPWDDNPRANDASVQRVAASIQTYGFLVPIVARKGDGRVLAGHTRIKAAKSLGLADVPVVWAELTDAQAKAFAIADNKLHELAEWNLPGLAGVLRELEAEDVDLFDLGFTESEVSSLWDDEAAADEINESAATGGGGFGTDDGKPKAATTRASLITLVLPIPAANEIEALVRAEQDADG